MSKTPRLSKSGIEYLTHSWGIFSGCHNYKNGICNVENCWAKGIALHYPKLYPNGFEPTFYPEALHSPLHLRKPARIGVGWVGDVIGCGLEYKEQIYSTIRACPQHTFLFLTKNYDCLAHWENFPNNCWVGVTITDGDDDRTPLAYMKKVKAKVKFISFEPLLHWWDTATSEMVAKSLKIAGISWVIIGTQTHPYKPPKIEWVRGIYDASLRANIPIFIKDNLKPLIAHHNELVCNECEAGDPCFACGAIMQLRQELPV